MASDTGPEDSGPRVLIADNDDLSAEITRRVMIAAGCSVDRAQDVDDAMTRLGISKPPFACVLVDLDENSSQGLKLLESIRTSSDPDVAATAVIICADTDANRRYFWQSGVDGFLKRPFHINALIDAMGDAMGRAPDERVRHRREQVALLGN